MGRKEEFRPHEVAYKPAQIVLAGEPERSNHGECSWAADKGRATGTLSQVVQCGLVEAVGLPESQCDRPGKPECRMESGTHWKRSWRAVRERGDH